MKYSVRIELNNLKAYPANHYITSNYLKCGFVILKVYIDLFESCDFDFCFLGFRNNEFSERYGAYECIKVLFSYQINTLK